MNYLKTFAMSWKKNLARQPKQIGGQGLVEFALILPIMLLLVIGALDIGRAFYMKVVLENSAREGASYMIYHTAEGKANSFALTKAAVQVEGQNSNVAIPLADIQINCLMGGSVNNTCPSESTVVVTVRHEMPLVFDILFNGPLELVSDARMLIP